MKVIGVRDITMPTNHNRLFTLFRTLKCINLFFIFKNIVENKCNIFFLLRFYFILLNCRMCKKNKMNLGLNMTFECFIHGAHNVI